MGRLVSFRGKEAIQSAGFAVILLVLVPTASAGTVEVHPQTLPGPKAFAAAVWTGEAVYLFGGTNTAGGFTRDIIRFDPAGTATLLAAMLPEAVIESAVAWDGTHAYIIGGKTATGYSDKITRFTPSTGTVAVLASKLPSPRGGSAAFWDDRDLPARGCPGGCVYVLGGRIGSYNDIDAIVKFNPGDGSVTTLPEVLPRRSSSHSVAWTGDKAYVVGIYEGNQGYLDPSIVEYTPTSGAVRTKSVALPFGRQSPAAVWNGFNVLVMGGYNNGATSQILRYDPVRDQIVNFAVNLPTGRYASAAVYQGALQTLVFGGYSSAGQTSQILRVFGDAPPSGPVDTTATAGPARGQVTVTWAPSSSNGGDPITGYRVYRGIAPDNVVHLATVISGTNYADTGHGDGLALYYQISAENSIGESVRSEVVSARTFSVPGVPQALIGESGPRRGSITLTWAAPAIDGGKPVTSYRIQIESEERGPMPTMSVGTSTNIAIENLLDGEQVSIRAAAVNELGEGPATSSIRVRAPHGPLSEIKTAPSMLTMRIGESAPFSAKGFDARGNEIPIQLTWSATCGAVDATGFYVAPREVGSCVIAATAESIQGRASVEVLPGPLASIEILAFPVEVGERVEFALIGFDRYANRVPIDPSVLVFEAPTRAGEIRLCHSQNEIEVCASVMVQPGPVARVAVELPDGPIVAGQSYPVVAKAFDRFENEVATSIALIAHRGQADDGIYAAPEVAGYDQIDAHVDGVAVSLFVEVVAGPLATLRVLPEAITLSAGEYLMIVVVGFDAFGNAVAIEPELTASCGSVTGSSYLAPTMADQACTIEARLGAIAGYSLIDVVAGPLDLLLLSGPESVEAGSVMTLRFDGYDFHRNLIHRATGSFEEAVPTQAGTAKTCIEIDGIEACWNYSVVPGPINGFELRFEESPLVVGSIYALIVEAFDRYRNPVMADPLVTAERGFMEGLQYRAPTLAGHDTVVAREGGVEASLSFVVIPGPLARLAVTGSTAVEVGSEIKFDAFGFDAFDNSVLFTPTWTASRGVIQADGRYAAPTVPVTAEIQVHADGVASPVHVVQVHAGPLAQITVVSPAAVANVWRPLTVGAIGHDRFGNDVPASGLEWSTDLGQISTTGKFLSTRTGNATILATVGEIVGALALPVVDRLGVEIEINDAAGSMSGLLRGDGEGKVNVTFADGSPVAQAPVAVDLHYVDVLGRPRSERLASGVTGPTGEVEFEFPAKLYPPGSYAIVVSTSWWQNQGMASRPHTVAAP
ncbi:MAG TPA: fibronectin type III domain-containing protein [Candidatus Thermoplasmatota archaeon]|nr:fibronectin type III domain-containing protein [Candidatus Thermoplasmatota archaeon]